MSRKLFSGDKCHHQNTYFICNKTSINQKQYNYDTYMHQRNSETKAIA